METLVEEMANRRRDPYSAAEAVLERIRFPDPAPAGARVRRRR